MPTVRGVISAFYQFKGEGEGPGGKKAPAKVKIDNQEYKAWNSLPFEIGQEVEIEYRCEVKGGYENNMIQNFKVLSGGGPPPGTNTGCGGGGHARTDAVGKSIENQVSLKVAGEIVAAGVAKGVYSKGDIEEALGNAYLWGINLLSYGTTAYDVFADE